MRHMNAPTRRVRHKKRGTTYEVLGEAEAQVTLDSSGMAVALGRVRVRDLTEGDKLTVYRCEKSGKLWLRFPDEFEDGRFEDIGPPDRSDEQPLSLAAQLNNAALTIRRMQDKLDSLEAIIGRLRKEAADTHYPTQWLQGLRYAISEIQTALAKPASEPAGGGVREAVETALRRIGGLAVIARKPNALRFIAEVAEREVAALSSPASSSPAEAEALPAGVDVEALTYRVANAKLGEGPSVRCEGPTDFEKDQARAWVKRVLRALSSDPAQEWRT